MRSPHSTTKSSPCSLQLEKARVQQQRPNAAKKQQQQQKRFSSVFTSSNKLSLINFTPYQLLPFFMFQYFVYSIYYIIIYLLCLISHFMYERYLVLSPNLLGVMPQNFLFQKSQLRLNRCLLYKKLSRTEFTRKLMLIECY